MIVSINTKPPKTPEEVRAELEEAGISLAEWTRAHNLSYDVARGVLSGRIKAKRGQAHQIAIALGLKQGRIISAKQFLQPPIQTDSTSADRSSSSNPRNTELKLIEKEKLG